MNIKRTIAKHVSMAVKRPSVYREFGDSIQNPVGELIFQDNGGDILFVGHLDWVHYDEPEFGKYSVSKCPQLDDRLGVAIGLELLPEIISEPIDILLTDCEEIGQSTASYFEPSKDYRWVVEFDRAGSDCVFYDYHSGELESSFHEMGVEVGEGSFTDICDLIHLGCQCVNFGCGYHGQHTHSCYANYAEVESQLARFAVWYKNHGARHYPWKPRRLKTKSTLFWESVQSPEKNYREECDYCRFSENEDLDQNCLQCGSFLDSLANDRDFRGMSSN